MMIEKDWLFSSDEYICDLRTVGVLVKNNRVLVQRDKNGSEYSLCPAVTLKLEKLWKQDLSVSIKKKPEWTSK